MKSTLFFIQKCNLLKLKLWTQLAFVVSLFFLQVSPANAQENCGNRVTAQSKLYQLVKDQCETTKKSPKCQDLYAKIKQDGGDLFAKALRCEVDSELSTGQKLAVSYIACLKGGLVDGLVGSVVDLGKFIGESAAKVHLSLQKDAERQKYCDQHPEMKEKIFTVYNDSVPKLLRVNTPKNLKSRSCAQLEADLYHAKNFQQRMVSQKLDHKHFQKNPQLSAEEKEYLDFKFKKQTLPEQSDKNLMDLADEALESWGVHIDCYNLEARTALRCEALFAIASIGYGGGKAALSALSGLKAERFAAQVTKVGQEAGSLKQISESSKLKILSSASKFSDSQRVTASESLLGRALTSEQQAAVIEAHKVGLGKGVRKYSPAELRKKAEILKQAGFSNTEREAMMRSGITGEFDDYIKAANLAQQREQELYKFIQQTERRQFEINARLKKGNLTDKEKMELEQELVDLDNKILSSRESIFGGSPIAAGAGPVDLARVERQIGFVSREIEIVEVNGGKVAGLLERRARTIRESAEFKAMGKDYPSAVKDYQLAAKDIERSLQEGGIKTFQEQVAAMRILENAGSSQFQETYQKLAAQIARSPQVKNQVINPEKMEFANPMVNPVVANQQKGSVWEMVREFKDQRVRIEVQRARNEDLAGHSWDKNQKMNSQFEAMLDKREKLGSMIEQKIRQEFGSSGANRAQKIIEQLDLK